MFAVMGITGKVGGAVANTLLQHGKKVRGIVRDASKARAWQEIGVEILTSELDDQLALAFRGVKGVFVMIPPNLARSPAFRIALCTSPLSRKPSSKLNRPGRISFFLGQRKTLRSRLDYCQPHA